MGIAKRLGGIARRLRPASAAGRFGTRRLPRRVRVAMIGTGKAARYHLKVLEKIGGAEVACIVNRGGSDPAALMQRHGIARSHVGVEAALSERGFDAAVVAVPPEATLAVSAALLDAGIHCLIEKPPGTTVAEAAELRDFGARADASAAVGFNRRCYSSVLKAAEYVDALGAPYAIHVDSPERLLKILKSGEPREVSENRIVANTCHSIDLFTQFAGEHEAVESAGLCRYFDDLRVDYVGLVRFRKGQAGLFSSHWASPGDRVVTLYGANYRLGIDLTRNELLATLPKGARRFAPDRIDRSFKAGVYVQDFRFLEAVAAGAPIGAPLATLEQAYETQRLSFALAGRAGDGSDA